MARCRPDLTEREMITHDNDFFVEEKSRGRKLPGDVTAKRTAVACGIS